MNLPILRPGFDPTIAPTTPTNSQLLQMVQAAHVATDIGIIYWGQSAPDLITYPDAVTALWGKLDGSDVPTGEFFYWYDDGVTAAWTPFTITSLNGSKITNGTITANKLSTAGATAGDILYYNGTSWTLAAIVASITDNTLPIAKIVKPSSGTGQVLYYNGSTLEWHNYTGTEILALIANKAIAVSKLAVGGARYVLRTKNDLSTVEYAAPSDIFSDYELSPLAIATDTEALSISSGVITLDAESGNGGPAFAVTLNTNITDFNVTNLESGREVFAILTQDVTGGRTVVWDAAIEWLDAVNPAVLSASGAITVVRFVNLNGTVYGKMLTANTSPIVESAEYTCVAGDTHTITHGLGGKPRYVRGVLICKTGENGYSAGDEIELCQLHSQIASAEYPSVTLRSSATEIIIRAANLGGTHLTTTTADGTAGVQLTPGNWRIKVYYSL
jgi:hypothetical protein